jgi:hypothetical protein
MCHLELSQPWHPLRHWGLKRQNQKRSMTTIFFVYFIVHGEATSSGWYLL